MISRAIVLSLLSVIAASAAAAPASAPTTEPTYTLLGEPCRAFNVLASRVVKTSDGKESLVLTTSNETTGVELIFIDFKANTGKSFRAPAGQGAWTLNEVPGQRLVVGTYYDGRFMVFDLKAMQFIKTAKVPGEQYIWNAVLGSDGRLYGGTYPGAKLAALNLSDYLVEDCGTAGAPNQYLRTVAALPDGRILCDYQTAKPMRRIYDPATKQFTEPAPQMKEVRRGVTWNGYFLATPGWEGARLTGPIAFQGPELKPIDPPPFPA